MSNDQWFFTDAQQQQVGPITFAQLQQLAAIGQIQAETFIWTEGMAEWTAAGQVQGVFQQAAPVAAAAPAANPYAVGGATQTGAPAGGAYPAPFVKKTSFGLYLGAYLLAIVLGIIALVSLIAAGKAMADDLPKLEEEMAAISSAETEEEMKIAKENLEAKQLEVIDEGALIGAGIGGLGLLAACIPIIFATIFQYIILYRSWHILQPGGARTTPGASVGFMFIPFFNFYWIFNTYVGWSTDWNRIRANYPDLQAAPLASRGMFIGALVCFLTVILSPVGIILFLICKKQMCDTINFFASRQSLGAGLGGAGTTGTMPNLV